MPETLLLPKFLTQEMAARVIARVVGAVKDDLYFPIKRRPCPVCRSISVMLHTVVLVPSMKDERAEDYPSWPNYPIQPYLLCEHSEHKDCNGWPWKFDDIARCKALQLWQDRNDDRTDVMPHLLFPGDAPFWGGVKRHGIVVATSGVQPHFDKMISGMVADMCVAMAHDAWLESQDHKDDVKFLI